MKKKKKKQPLNIRSN